NGGLGIVAGKSNPSGQHVTEYQEDGVVTDEPSAAEGARHFGQVHGTYGDENSNTKSADESTRLEHPVSLVRLSLMLHHTGRRHTGVSWHRPAMRHRREKRKHRTECWLCDQKSRKTTS